MSLKRLIFILAIPLSITDPAQAQDHCTAGGFKYSGVDELRVREWRLDPEDPHFPETADPRLATLFQRDSFGIAFSGGGTRAASAALGELRALKVLGWLEQARYITAVSGGAWAAVPFTFLPSHFTDGQFLGPYIPPSELDEKLVRSASRGSFAQAIATAPIPGLYLSRVLWRYDETYSRAIGKKILRDFDLYQGEDSTRDCEGPPRFFAAHAAQRDRLISNAKTRRPIYDRWKCLCSPSQHADDQLCADEFLLPAADRPFLIAGATFLEKKRRVDASHFHPVELTPLYSGIRKSFEFEHKGRTFTFGGGFIESVAYDSISRTPLPGTNEVDVCFKRPWPSPYRYRFTLADMMGSTGAAPVAIFRGLGIDTLGFPEFYHRPIGTDGVTAKAAEFAHGDGEHIDNLGLLPLLARKVQKILVFSNTQTEFKVAPDGELTMSSDIRCYFTPDPDSTDDLCAEKKRGALPIFAPQGLREIQKTFLDQHSRDEPLVHCGVFEVEQALHGIQVYKPQICWFHLAGSEAWSDRIQNDGKSTSRLLRKLKNERGQFKNFPHFRTIGERWWKLRLIDMSTEQVNALSHLTAWEVLTQAKTIGDSLGLSLSQTNGSYPDPEKRHEIPASQPMATSDDPP